MLSTSFAFRRYVAEGGHLLNRIELSMADGTAHELDGSAITMGGLSASSATSKSGEFSIGSAVVGTARITLANYGGEWDDADFTDATCVISVGAPLADGTVEWLRKGIYGVEQPESYDSTITLDMRDGMRLFQRPYSDVRTAYPATLRTIVADVASVCGVTMASADFPGAGQVASLRPDDDGTTCLDVLAWAAQMAGCFCDMDPFGRLRVRWYETGVYETEDWLDGGTYDTGTTPYGDGDAADGGAFHSGGDPFNGGGFTEPRWATVTAIKSLTTATDDVVVTGVRVTAADQVRQDGTGGQKGESYLYGTEGYVLEVGGNPLIAHGSAQSVASQIGPAVVGMRFRPLTVSALGDPAIEAGDPMLVVDRRQRTYRSWVTQTTWVAGGFQSLSCDARTPARNKADSYSAVTRAIVQLRNSARAEATARERAIADLAEQLVDTCGLYATEEVLQDGSTVYYAHDRPTLAESQIVWKFTANAFAWSTDGGATYPFGVDVTGAAILDRIYTIGLDASYVNAGRVAFDGGGWIDFELGTMGLGDTSSIGGQTVKEMRDAIDDARRQATDYIAYRDGELTLGAGDSAIRNVLTNQRMAYRTDAGDVAWFGLTEDDIWNLFIETASVQNRLNFNDFAWIARQNGNMTLKWTGA